MLHIRPAWTLINNRVMPILKRDNVRFVIFFVLIYIIGQCLYLFYQSYVSSYLDQNLYVDTSSWIINRISPTENTLGNHNIILSKGRPVVIVGEDCDGIVGILILAAALFAFPMKWSKKVLGVVSGTFFLCFINLIRIIALYYLFKYRPDISDFMHIYVGQPVFIFCGILFFLAWIRSLDRINEKNRPKL